MIQLKTQAKDLIFKYPFKIAHGVRSITPVVFIKLIYEGVEAYGEASMPPYLGESHQSVLAFLEKAKPFLNSLQDVNCLDDILKEIDDLEKGNSAAKAAIDIALHDLIGKLNNKPLWQIFELKKANTPYSTHTIGIDEEKIVKQKIEETNQFKILKIKLDGINDKEIINSVRKHTDKPIAVDVNQGWKSINQALHMIDWLATQKVILIEQPLPVNMKEESKKLFANSILPIYADESIQRLKDLNDVKDCFHGINIKLMKSTGINEARKMIQLAKKYQLKILIGCMSESSCAISAAAQLSPLADYADLDGSQLITNDMFNGIKYDDGKIMLNERPGIGVECKSTLFEEGK
jgi:L-Ala-D/L-Glu epimerase